tara:strand:- start:398 stop:835 length:438 start_codon:yes stop_codon:yes gene_type:complete
MKNLLLTITILLYYLSSSAQMDFSIYDFSVEKEIPSIHQIRITNYSNKVISDENFSYRIFLKESRRSGEKYNIGEQQLNKKDLTKLLRKFARKSGDEKEFKQYLIRENPEFINYFSDNHTPTLYTKFKKGTLNNYIVELIQDWRN